MVRQLENERVSGEADRLGARVEALAKDIAQGNINLARLPGDRLPGVIAQMRAWENEWAGLLERLHELENGTEGKKKILAEARRQMWRLRESLEDGDEEVQAAVVREVVSKVEVHFAHEPTHGQRSPTGKGRTLNKAIGATVYFGPGLGLSCLVIADCRNPARVGAGSRASSCRSACAAPG